MKNGEGKGEEEGRSKGEYDSNENKMTSQDLLLKSQSIVVQLDKMSDYMYLHQQLDVDQDP